MAGIELYAERKRRHRRTWTIAAIVLAAVFMLGGQLVAYFPAIAAGFITPGGGTDGWPQLTYELVAAFGLEVSGVKIDSLPLITDLTATPGAAWWLTGGAFGPEASVAATAVLGLGVIVLMVGGKTRDRGVEAAPVPA